MSHHTRNNPLTTRYIVNGSNSAVFYRKCALFSSTTTGRTFIHLEAASVWMVATLNYYPGDRSLKIGFELRVNSCLLRRASGFYRDGNATSNLRRGRRTLAPTLGWTLPLDAARSQIPNRSIPTQAPPAR